MMKISEDGITKLIIAGGRDFTNYAMAEEKINQILINVDYAKLEIVSGGARGADRIGERFAEEYDIPVKHFIPDWDGLGRKAGHVRNRQMAEYGTHLIAFWDGVSRGTSNMIQEARSLDLKVRAVRY